MKIIIRTSLAILLAIALIQICVILVKTQTIHLKNFRLLSLASGLAGIYYFVFERKKK